MYIIKFSTKMIPISSPKRDMDSSHRASAFGVKQKSTHSRVLQ